MIMTPAQVDKLLDKLNRIAVSLEEITKIFIRLEELLQPPEDTWDQK